MFLQWIKYYNFMKFATQDFYLGSYVIENYEIKAHSVDRNFK